MAGIFGFALTMIPLLLVIGSIICYNVWDMLEVAVIGELLLLGFVIGIYFLVGGV